MNKFNVINILIILAIVLLVIFLFVIITSPVDTKTASTNTKQNIVKNTNKTNTINNNQNKVYIVNHKAESLSIKGVVKNNTNKTIENVKIEADIYDKSGNKIKSSYDWIEELKTNETWAFSIYTGETSYIYKNIRLNYK